MRCSFSTAIVVLLTVLILPVTAQTQEDRLFDARAYQKYEEQERRAYVVYDSIESSLYQKYEREDSEEFKKFSAVERKLLLELKRRDFGTYVEWIETEKWLDNWRHYQKLISTVPELKKISSARESWNEARERSWERFEKAKSEAWERYEAAKSNAWKWYEER